MSCYQNSNYSGKDWEFRMVHKTQLKFWQVVTLSLSDLKHWFATKGPSINYIPVKNKKLSDPEIRLFWGEIVVSDQCCMVSGHFWGFLWGSDFCTEIYTCLKVSEQKSVVKSVPDSKYHILGSNWCCNSVTDSQFWPVWAMNSIPVRNWENFK
jgi:hypothetical protein